MNKSERITRDADEAARLLNSPMWIAAWEETRQAVFAAWEQLPSSDRTQSDELHRTLKNLARIKRVLETHIQTGKLAEKELRAKSGLGSIVQRMRG